MIAVDSNIPETELRKPIRWAGLIARSVFITTLIVVTIRAASPQYEHLRTIYETPSDLLRVILGALVCAWLVAHLFILPKDAEGYRTWAQMGLVLVPLSLLGAFLVW